MKAKNEVLIGKLLDEIQQQEITLEDCLKQYPELASEILDLYAITVELNSISIPKPDPHFRSQSFNRIMNTLEERSVTNLPWYRQLIHSFQLTQKRRYQMTITLIVMLVVSLFGGGTVYASQNALPGDGLYSLKLQIEDLKLQFATEEDDQELYLQFANERVNEIKALIEEGRFADISIAMKGYSHAFIQAMATSEGEEETETSRTEVYFGLSNSLEVITRLMAEVPQEAYPGLEVALTEVHEAFVRLNAKFSNDSLELEELDSQVPSPQDIVKDKLENLPVELPEQVLDTIPAEIPPVPPVELPLELSGEVEGESSLQIEIQVPSIVPPAGKP